MFLFAGIVLLVFTIISLIVSRKLKIENEVDDGVHFYPHVNKFHKYIEILSAILFLMSMGVLVYLGCTLKGQYIFGYFTLLFGFRSFMEWKYNKGSKSHILTFTGFCACLIIFLGLLIFFE